ncbi:MAG TPA: hypothetical protein VHU87_02375 [Rhizomicrobium sp.]|nr:hypothetical protein [Rhizomicrobium sp.]
MKSLAIVACIFAVPAFAAPLGTPTPGYVYFHKTHATLAAHNDAVETCAANSAAMLGPMAPRFAGLIGTLITESEDESLARINFAANVENCMVAAGWDVVRLDDAEGAGIAALDPQRQAETLAPWVGADQVHGQIVRRYQPLNQLARIAAGLSGSAQASLSVTSDADNIDRRVQTVPQGPDRPAWFGLEESDDPARIPADATVIVVRARA